MQKGFTFIEILVVVALMGTIMLGTVGFLMAVLKTSRKSEATTGLKQAGDQALELISSIVRNSSSVACNDELDVIRSDGVTEVFSCSGESLVSDVRGVLISSGVESCAFTCILGDGNMPDSVTIKFTLFSEGDPTTQASIDFETSVSLRNY